ncbi:hypothetical protein [Allosediminivita pacifica]|nr:hypothetical protein [Allosediminivita pacifica]GGB23564.1 hypothetical protein GCM10011324_36970 [Allosediminivita pacifica]
MTSLRAIMAKYVLVLALLVLGVEPVMARTAALDCVARTAPTVAVMQGVHETHRLHADHAAEEQTETSDAQAAPGICCIGMCGLAMNLLPHVDRTESTLIIARHHGMSEIGANLVDPKGPRKSPKG